MKDSDYNGLTAAQILERMQKEKEAEEAKNKILNPISTSDQTNQVPNLSTEQKVPDPIPVPEKHTNSIIGKPIEASKLSYETLSNILNNTSIDTPPTKTSVNEKPIYIGSYDKNDYVVMYNYRPFIRLKVAIDSENEYLLALADSEECVSGSILCLNKTQISGLYSISEHNYKEWYDEHRTLHPASIRNIKKLGYRFFDTIKLYGDDD